MPPVNVFYANRPRQLSELLKTELDPNWSREAGVVKAGQTFDLGQVIAALTADGPDLGKLVAFNPAGVDGSETIVGVSQMVVDASDNDVYGVPYSARGAVLSLSGLRGLDALTAPQKAAALAQLTALGLIVRVG